jgi:hypothetical protein
MSWKFVFNTLQCEKTMMDYMFTYPDEVAKIAREAGYKFFTWKENVYFVLPGEEGKWDNTNIKVSDLF